MLANSKLTCAKDVMFFFSCPLTKEVGQRTPKKKQAFLERVWFVAVTS